MKPDTASKAWSIEVLLEETGDETKAEALLELRGDRLVGWGRARRNPQDPAIPRIGEELATARALGELAHKLLDVAATEIEKYEGTPVTPHA
jgi:hypothetical protein